METLWGHLLSPALGLSSCTSGIATSRPTAHPSPQHGCPRVPAPRGCCSSASATIGTEGLIGDAAVLDSEDVSAPWCPWVPLAGIWSSEEAPATLSGQ